MNVPGRDEPNDTFDSAESVGACRAAESTDKWKEVSHRKKQSCFSKIKTVFFLIFSFCLFVGVFWVFEGELGVTPAKTSQLHRGGDEIED